MRIVVIGGYAPSLILFRGPLLAAMVARGHEVIAMAADGDAATRDALAAMGVGFEALAIERAGLDPRADARTLAHLTRRLRQLRPDAVLGYTIKPVVWGSIAARLAGVPRRYAMITGLGYAFLGQERLARRVLARAVQTLYRAGLAGCHAIFFQNPDDRAEFASRGLLPRHARIEVLRGSGVDVDHYAPVPLPDGPPTFIYVGRLLKEKGILDYVEAARRVRARRPEARFVVVGGLDPNPASVTRAEVEAWQQEGVIAWRGEVRDVRPELARASVLILPSYREGTPRSVLEAMSLGRPVITTDVPGCRETIVDGEHGLLVPVRDPAAVADACLRLIDAPARVAAMGSAARARILALYDARAVAARMLEVMGL